jgi:hypothetical protein
MSMPGATTVEHAEQYFAPSTFTRHRPHVPPAGRSGWKQSEGM